MATEDEVNFYSRPREGGDQWATARNARFTNFYSRPREGGDIQHPQNNVIGFLFLLTPPRRGRLGEVWDTPQETTHFYSRPRVGGDDTIEDY